MLSEYQTCIFIRLNRIIHTKKRKYFVKRLYIKFFKNPFYGKINHFSVSETLNLCLSIGKNFNTAVILSKISERVH